jgi:lysozyme family protein
MANWSTAYNWMMDNEDSARAYAVVSDVGGFAISGINSKSFCGEFAAIAALPQNERAAAVERFYGSHFWNILYDQLTSDEVAKRVFDMAVNAGERRAVRLLQESINSWGGFEDGVLKEDGKLGKDTVELTNACNADGLVAEFSNNRCNYYRSLAAANPADEQYLAGWMARANR